MKPRRWAGLLLVLAVMGLEASSAGAAEADIVRGDGQGARSSSRTLLQNGCGTATLTSSGAAQGNGNTVSYVALGLTASRGSRVISLGVGLSARTNLRVYATSSRSLAAVNSLLDQGQPPPRSWTALLGSRQGVPGLAEYLFDLPLVLAPNQTAVIVIMASDAAIQASRPAGSTVQLTVTDSFLTVQGPAWYGDLTYTVTAGCVPQSTHAAAAVEIEGYSPQNFTDVHVAQFMVSMVYQAGLMRGFSDPNAAVRANSMFLVGVTEAVQFRPGVSFIVYGDFPTQDVTREFGRQVQRLFDSNFAPSFSGFLKQQGLPQCGRLALSRVWHDEPAIGDIMPTGASFAGISAADSEPLTKGGIAGVVIGCVVLAAMIIALVALVTRPKPLAAPKKGPTRADKLREEAERLQLEEIFHGAETNSPDEEPRPSAVGAPAAPISFPLKMDPPTPKATISLQKIGETPVWNDPGNTPPPKQRPLSISEKKEY